MKGVRRFRKKGKISPHYVCPYGILKRACEMVYELELAIELTSLHPVFHVSIIKMCIGDLVWILPLEGLGVKSNFLMKRSPLRSWIFKLRNLGENRLHK